MGDRANVLVKSDNSRVYLYTHSAGYDLPGIVKQALIRGESRWDDGQYLARIMFCEMVKGYEMDTSGFGISSVVGDGSGRIIEVNVGLNQVNWGGKTLSFREFTNLKTPSWD